MDIYQGPVRGSLPPGGTLARVTFSFFVPRTTLDGPDAGAELVAAAAGEAERFLDIWRNTNTKD